MANEKDDDGASDATDDDDDDIIMERCTSWPTCNDERCIYWHPNEICKDYPQCPHERCIFIHSDERPQIIEIEKPVKLHRRRWEGLNQCLTAHNEECSWLLHCQSDDDDDAGVSSTSFNDSHVNPQKPSAAMVGATTTTTTSMLDVIFTSWNIEWMHDCFYNGPRSLDRDEEDKKPPPFFFKHNYARGIPNVKLLCEARANIIIGLGPPDVVTVLEGPNDIAKMRLFCNTFLNGIYNIYGGQDGWDQRIYVLVRRFGPLQDIEMITVPIFKENWHVDLTGDLSLEPYNFTRQPVVLSCSLRLTNEGEVCKFNNSKNETSPLSSCKDSGSQTSAQHMCGKRIVLISLHGKSKYVNRAQKLMRSPCRRDRIEFLRKAVYNRRRLLTEAIRIRDFLSKMGDNEEHSELCVISGDLNDGPGMSFFERTYLIGTSCDALLGSSCYPGHLYRHAFLHNTNLTDPLYSVTRCDLIDEDEVRKLLLDHIIVSPALNAHVVGGGVAKDLFNEVDRKYEVNLFLFAEKCVLLDKIEQKNMKIAQKSDYLKEKHHCSPSPQENAPNVESKRKVILESDFARLDVKCSNDRVIKKLQKRQQRKSRSLKDESKARVTWTMMADDAPSKRSTITRNMRKKAQQVKRQFMTEIKDGVQEAQLVIDDDNWSLSDDDDDNEDSDETSPLPGGNDMNTNQCTNISIESCFPLMPPHVNLRRPSNHLPVWATLRFPRCKWSSPLNASS